MAAVSGKKVYFSLSSPISTPTMQATDVGSLYWETAHLPLP